MNYSGTVKLVVGERVLHSYSYFSREDRKKIINRWIDLYKETFERYEVAITPNVFSIIKGQYTSTGRLNRLQRLQEQSVEKRNVKRRTTRKTVTPAAVNK